MQGQTETTTSRNLYLLWLGDIEMILDLDAPTTPASLAAEARLHGHRIEA